MMGEQMGVPKRNLFELDGLVTGLEEAVTRLQERIAYLEAWAKSQGLLPPPGAEESVDSPFRETHP